MASLHDDQTEASPPQPLLVRFDLLNVALAAAIVVLVVRAFSLVDLMRQVLLLMALAILFAPAFEPLVARLRRGGISRAPSVLGIYVAICVVGGDPANHTQRLVANSDRVLVGATGFYEARCRHCFDPQLAAVEAPVEKV